MTKPRGSKKSNKDLDCDSSSVIVVNLRGRLVEWRFLERDEALCHNEPEGLWDGKEGM